jgi:hypothetical protein
MPFPVAVMVNASGDFWDTQDRRRKQVASLKKIYYIRIIALEVGV